jgi:hypothetical protein
LSFRLAAIKILSSAKGPLHVDENTNRALESGLIKTSGTTPKNTMSTEIRRDIKRKQSSSAFRLIGKSVFTLNPTLTQEKSIERKGNYKRARGRI